MKIRIPSFDQCVTALVLSAAVLFLGVALVGCANQEQARENVAQLRDAVVVAEENTKQLAANPTISPEERAKYEKAVKELAEVKAKLDEALKNATGPVEIDLAKQAAQYLPPPWNVIAALGLGIVGTSVYQKRKTAKAGGAS